MQISEDELFAAQSFSIGGQSSVRGFKDESIHHLVRQRHQCLY
jgi:hemolysin activation/secretion protein